MTKRGENNINLTIGFGKSVDLVKLLLIMLWGDDRTGKKNERLISDNYGGELFIVMRVNDFLVGGCCDGQRTELPLPTHDRQVIGRVILHERHTTEMLVN